MNGSVKQPVLVVVSVLCLVILCLSTSVGQDRKSYEVPAQIYGVPAWAPMPPTPWTLTNASCNATRT